MVGAGLSNAGVLCVVTVVGAVVVVAVVVVLVVWVVLVVVVVGAAVVGMGSATVAFTVSRTISAPSSD